MDSVRTDSGSQNHSRLIQDILAQHADQRGSLLPILHAVQDVLGYIPDDAVSQIAAGIQRSRAEVHGVIHFYTHFRTAPPARLQVEVCRAESCQACGGEALYRHAEQRVAGQPADQVSLSSVYCLGLCAQSPAVMVNGRPHARVTAEQLDVLLER
ncbi:NAD(P)H-dependent oxidoreductase subunit E [Castellaniella sp.]|uniref:NAD(P)H-dependent oxidoreductase subunit E n=1 Tax=Castellaniella sp. TaxID=1955812 RepID=UPI002AFE32F0|nr:NAD(P)H-dependent oxidoreductase subunit E [Castellaniella sp.]